MEFIDIQAVLIHQSLRAVWIKSVAKHAQRRGCKFGELVLSLANRWIYRSTHFVDYFHHVFVQTLLLNISHGAICSGGKLTQRWKLEVGCHLYTLKGAVTSDRYSKLSSCFLHKLTWTCMRIMGGLAETWRESTDTLSSNEVSYVYLTNLQVFISHMVFRSNRLFYIIFLFIQPALTMFILKLNCNCFCLIRVQVAVRNKVWEHWIPSNF